MEQSSQAVVGPLEPTVRPCAWVRRKQQQQQQQAAAASLGPLAAVMSALGASSISSNIRRS